MKINEKYYITKKHGSASVIVTNLIDDKKKTFTDTDMEYSPLLQIIQTCRQANKGSRTAEEIRTTLNRLYLMVGVTSDFDARYPDYCAIAVVKDEDGNIVKEVDKEEAMRCLKRLEKFFSEYSFTLSHRFVNTLGWVADKQAYIKNYFLIQNDANAVDIADKVTSDEFKSIMDDLEASGYEHPTETINKRLLVFFGAPGSGKTTLASTMGENMIVCRSDMLPTDLLEDFKFDDGKAGFHKSVFWKAMEEGTPVILDEINMLPFETLRFLQGITDNKPYIDYKGERIEIADGFKVIGTMNLDVGNGMRQPLFAPLVDRCEDIREFVLTADMLRGSWL